MCNKIQRRENGFPWRFPGLTDNESNDSAAATTARLRPGRGQVQLNEVVRLVRRRGVELPVRIVVPGRARPRLGQRLAEEDFLKPRVLDERQVLDQTAERQRAGGHGSVAELVLRETLDLEQQRGAVEVQEGPQGLLLSSLHRRVCARSDHVVTLTQGLDGR